MTNKISTPRSDAAYEKIVTEATSHLYIAKDMTDFSRQLELELSVSLENQLKCSHELALSKAHAEFQSSRLEHARHLLSEARTELETLGQSKIWMDSPAVKRAEKAEAELNALKQSLHSHHESYCRKCNSTEIIEETK
jgi:hypothetical protein